MKKKVMNKVGVSLAHALKQTMFVMQNRANIY